MMTVGVTSTKIAKPTTTNAAAIPPSKTSSVTEGLTRELAEASSTVGVTSPIADGSVGDGGVEGKHEEKM